MPKRSTIRLQGPALARYITRLRQSDAALARALPQAAVSLLCAALMRDRVRIVARASGVRQGQALAFARRFTVASGTAAPAKPDQPEAAVPTSQGLAKAAARSGFDPYAFSVVALLIKSGRDAVLARLHSIADPTQLRNLADAQHLAVGSNLSAADELRSAILASAERRVAERRAAAS